MKMPGLFITFEGLDGCGKSTQMHLAADFLREQGYSPVTTREPGGCGIAEQIRGILLDERNDAMDPLTEALLYAAARRQHVKERVSPALADGKIVLSDRFVDSSVAYQGYGRDLGPDAVAELNAPAVSGCMPDLTLFFDCPPELARQRLAEQSIAPDRLEGSSASFFDRVYDGFSSLCEQHPERFVRIDATGPAEKTQDLVRQTILAALPPKGEVDA